MQRVLLIATTTGYQTRTFSETATRLGVELLFATDRCHLLDDPWKDKALPVRFHEDVAFVKSVTELNERTPIDGVLGLGDRPAVFAALACEAIGLPGHPPAAARASGNKFETRQRFAAAGLPCPRFHLRGAADDEHIARSLEYPCVVKPLALSGSRGVIRADGPAELLTAVRRVRRLLSRGDIRERRHEADDHLVFEAFIPGREFAVEGVLENGQLQTLALFDKPDPMDGPVFEESIYITPSREPIDLQERIERAITTAASALGLSHGPVHAECRVNDSGIYVLEVAARPIGGLCARALRFQSRQGDVISLEELLLRHALGEPVSGYTREDAASGVMMIPIPRAGMYRRTERVDAARATPGVVDVVITAKPDQRLEPLPEGASYLGFIFARAEKASEAVTALRSAHATLQFVIDAPVPMA
jgi:biotin carboxylase